MKRAVARVDLNAIRSNLELLRARAGDAEVMAVVKADAYGHGMVQVARTARGAGIAWLGVALPKEALTLRRQGDTGRILAWLWAPGDEDVASCVEQQVDLSVSSAWALEEILAAAESSGQVARIHVKVDTGLTRNGVPFEDLPTVLDLVREAEESGLIAVEGIWSHLADGDTPMAASVQHQRDVFERALALAETHGVRPRLRHLGNSGSLFAHPDCRYDMVRTGIAMYGLTPSLTLGTAASLGLTPAMSIVARLAHVKAVDAGTAISYGWRWSAAKPTSVGLVPVGYADGIPRAAGAPRPEPAVEVAIGGARFDVVGTVAMDQFVVHLDTDDVPEVGTDVHLFGPGGHGEWAADDWAEAVGTIGYEIVTRIGPRIDREYVNEEVTS